MSSRMNRVSNMANNKTRTMIRIVNSEMILIISLATTTQY